GRGDRSRSRSAHRTCTLTRPRLHLSASTLPARLVDGGEMPPVRRALVPVLGRDVVVVEHGARPRVLWPVAALINRAPVAYPRAMLIPQHDPRAILRRRLNRLPAILPHRIEGVE